MMMMMKIMKMMTMKPPPLQTPPMFTTTKEFGQCIMGERMDKLNAIGFEWNAEWRSVKSWDELYEQLIDFRRKHGHCNVSAEDLKSNQDSKENDKTADRIPLDPNSKLSPVAQRR